MKLIQLLAMLRVGLDIDDTIAGFSEGYIRRFKKWPNYDWAITRNVHNILIHEREFWLNLPVLRRPDFEPRLYCSARVSSKHWTKKYLKDNDFPNSPLYQIPGYKLSKVRTLKGKVDVFVDDSVKNFIDLNLNGVPCLLMDSSNNQDWGPICRIYSLQQDEIEDAYLLAKECNIFNDFKNLL